MIYYAQTTNSKQYDIRIWKCTSFKEHWHSSTEIYICLKGEVKILIEKSSYLLKPNDAVFVFGNEAHEIFCDNDRTEVILVGFGHGLLGSSYNNIQNAYLSDRFFNLLDNDVSLKLKNPLLEIKKTLLNGNDYTNNWKFLSCLYSISAYLYENANNSPVLKERLLRTKHLEKMHEILDCIYKNYRENLTLEYASKIVGYERSYFSKQFLKTVGMPFHKYLNYFRACKAMELLLDNKLSLSLIAEKTGFSSQKNLSRIFKDFFDITPMQYKKLPFEEKMKFEVVNYT